MRPIKFRAWSKELKRFVSARDCSKQVMPVKRTDFGFELVSEFELSQFTGLKDKNGVEIYEGDIVLIHQSLGNSKIVADIKVGFSSDCSPEVIGNIHENPELLK